MDRRLQTFERIVRMSYQLTDAREDSHTIGHPFDERNLHHLMPDVVRQLFDDGHYSQATFEMYKFVDNQVQMFANSSETGYKLMMQAFAKDNPQIKLTPLKTTSDKDEQTGFQFLFAGAVLAVRNPRGHKVDVADDVDTCLDHLSLASMLLRRLEAAGFAISP